MGVDLTLIVNENGNKSYISGYERIRLDRDYVFFEQIEKSKPQSIGYNRFVSWYEDEGISDEVEDNYGEKLTSMSAKEMHRIMSKIKDGMSTKNKAVMAYMGALEPETEIILWWR